MNFNGLSLYLVEGTLSVYSNLSDDPVSQRTVIRIVWAQTEYDAKDKMEREYDRDNWDNTVTRIEITSVTEAID